MQVTSPGAAAAWDTPTIEPNLPPSVNAYDPGNPDNGGTLDSPPPQLDSSASYETVETKPLLQGAAPGFEILYTKPLLVDPTTGEALQVQHTKPLQIAPESAMQAASPDAANAVAAPKASAMEIAALELLLAEPANQDMIAQFGPPLAPLNTGTDVGSGIQARFGADLGARLTQLQEAQNKVRDLYTKAVDAASSAPGPGVAGCEYVLGTGGESGTESYWKFDAVAFSTQYAAGESPAQKAFAQLHGREPLRYELPDERNESGGNPGGYFLGDRKLSLGYPNDGAPGMRHHGRWVPATLSSDQLSPEKNADLINKEYLWFDPVNGWSTDGSNIKGDWIDKAIPLVFAGGLTMMTAGAFGITAASASTSLGQSMALGAISSASMQLTTGGKLDLGNILRSALTAGVTFGVMDASGVSGALQSTELATRTLGHLGKAGLQGLLQEATGGKFKDGLTNSLISSVAGEVGKSLDNHIAELSKDGTLNVQEASTLRLMSRAASSAVRVAGSGGDAAGFASDFLGGLMEEANPFAGKAEAGGKADKANKADNTSTTSNTSQGAKPDNEWVQSLGASDVDPNQAQGLKPGGSLQGLRVSGDALSGWGDEIDGGIALNGSMAPEARTTGEAVVGRGQGPLAALAAAGLSAQEQQAAYGQLLASGQVRLNAQGVPMVQPGQVLRFDLSDTGAAQLGGRAIAAESGGRVQREALAAQQTAETYTGAGGGRGFVNPTLAGATKVPARDDGLFSRASMNEYWSGDDILSRGMRTVGNAAYDVAEALTPADSTPQELQRARELGQLRQSFNAAREAGDIAEMLKLQVRHAQITSADGNPSMVQVSMASDILRAQTAQGLSADRGSLGLAAGAAITQGFAGMVAPTAGGSIAGANGGAATSGGAANATTYAGLKLDLKTTQAANEVIDSLRATGKLPSNYVDKAEAAQQGWRPGKALNNAVPGGQLGGDIFNNVPPVNGLPQGANRTWQEADIGLNNTMSRSNQPGTRLLYSNDGLLYITTDHYKTVTPIGTWKN